MFSRRKELQANSKSASQNPMNFLSWFRSSAPGTMLGGGNVRCLRPLKLHRRTNLPCAQATTSKTLWRLYMAKPYPYYTRRRKETQNYTLPEVRQSQKETASQIPAATRSLLHSLCQGRRAGLISEGEIRGVFATAVTEHHKTLPQTSRAKRLTSQMSSNMLQASWTGEQHGCKLHCCKI